MGNNNIKTWRRKDWSAFYKELTESDGDQAAGEEVWALWNTPENENKEQFKDKVFFLVDLAAYRESVMIGTNGIFNISYISQPVYSTWTNWYNSIYHWELAQWQIWYEALKDYYGKEEAQKRFQNAWSYADNWVTSMWTASVGYQGGYDCDFINYFRYRGLDVALFGAENLCTLVSVATNLIDATENVSEVVTSVTSGASGLAKFVIPIVLIGGSLSIYFQIKRLNKK